MHSRVGAWAEANQVYVAQANLETKKESVPFEKVPTPFSSPFTLFDVGMGTAANAVAMIEKWRRLGSSRTLKIVSFERYPEALEKALEFQFDFLKGWEAPLRELLSAGQLNVPELKNVEWQLVRGDIREVDFSELPKPHLIFFDFYSPQTCPELWTEEIFSLFDKNARLITYASNKSIRVALLLAGFYVAKGASTTMKLETTVAGPGDLENLLDAKWLSSLERSSRKFPLERIRAHPQFKEFTKKL